MKIKSEYTKKETPYPIVCARTLARSQFTEYARQLQVTMDAFLDGITEDIIVDLVGNEVWSPCLLGSQLPQSAHLNKHWVYGYLFHSRRSICCIRTHFGRYYVNSCCSLYICFAKILSGEVCSMEVLCCNLYFMVIFLYSVSIRFLGFIGIILYPIDIGYSIEDKVANSKLKVLWDIVYWVTFFLSWVIIPILMEYWASGEFKSMYSVFLVCHIAID